MTKLNIAQWSALGQLNSALRLATTTGLLDVMQQHVTSPDSINDVCNTLDHIKDSPAPTESDHHRERFTNALLRQYQTQQENVFVEYVRTHDDLLRAMMREVDVPNPVDLEFIRRASADDYEQGARGRAVFQSVYERTKVAA